MDYRQLAYQTAQKYGIDPDLFVRQIQAESAFRPDAVSPAGAIGLGQLMPATARELGVDPRDPVQNLEGSARYMKQQLDAFKDPALALAAYNAGPSRVRKAGGIPNITETQNYVSKILGSGNTAMVTDQNMNAGTTAEQAAAQAAAASAAMQEQSTSDKYKDIAGNLAVAFNSMRLNADPALASTIKDIRTSRTEKQAKNKTLAYLEEIGREDLVSAIGAGLSPREAIAQMFSEAAELRGFNRQKELIDYKVGVEGAKSTDDIREYELAKRDGFTGTFTDFLRVKQEFGSTPQGYRLERGKDEQGMDTFRYVKVEGGPADTEAKQVQAAEEQRKKDQLQKDYAFLGAGERVITAIDKDPTLIPKTGIIAGMVSDTVFGQKQKNVAEDLAIMESQMQFETLADLKRASPTGASGLGQLTDAERRALGKIKQNFSNLQSEDAIKRTIRSASLMRTYMKNGVRDVETGKYRNATDAEIEMMVQGINPFGPDSGAVLEGLPSGIFQTQGTSVSPAQSGPKRYKYNAQGELIDG